MVEWVALLECRLQDGRPGYANMKWIISGEHCMWIACTVGPLCISPFWRCRGLSWQCRLGLATACMLWASSIKPTTTQDESHPTTPHQGFKNTLQDRGSGVLLLRKSRVHQRQIIPAED